MNPFDRLAAAALPALLLAGCYDLDVTNPNAPDLSRAFGSAAEVEVHVANAFREWHAVETGRGTPPLILSGVSFQHGTWAVCDAPHAEIPRRPIENDLDSQCIASLRAWESLYRSLARVADGLAVLDQREDFRAELGPDRVARLEAFARFVQGLAHGSLALLFDRGARLDETTDRIEPRELLDYAALMAAALGYLDEAAALSAGARWPAIPAEWMSVEVAPDQLARLTRSYAARLRASAARTPAERDAVDWAAVLADAEAGITEDWVVDGGEDWFAAALLIYRMPRPTQASYFILGMADQSGSYQRWLSRPLFDRVPNPAASGDGGEDPILIVTPDTRFPQGATVEEQLVNGGTMYVNLGAEGSLWGFPARGTWRWSFYRYIGADDHATLVDTRWPAFTAAEVRLLKAEAMLRSDNPAGAAALVNESRTAHGLSPTDAGGTNVECVPRLPDGTCGGLMEMLKWEKRLETLWKGPFLSSWYFDGRGWGDLYAGTFLQVPVPCSELTLLQLACYTFGGPGGEWTSPGSVYGWPDEPAG